MNEFRLLTDTDILKLRLILKAEPYWDYYVLIEDILKVGFISESLSNKIESLYSWALKKEEGRIFDELDRQQKLYKQSQKLIYRLLRWIKSLI